MNINSIRLSNAGSLYTTKDKGKACPEKGLRRDNLNYDEKRIIEGCIEGEREYQSELYKYMSSELYPICLRYATDENQAMDYLHDSFMTIYEKIETFKGKGSFVGWAKRITTNTALMSIRKNKKLLFSGEIKVSDYEEIDLDKIDQLEKLDVSRVFELILDLPQGCRTVFNLYELDGLKHHEIASQLGITEGTSKSQLFKARKLLKKMILDE